MGVRRFCDVCGKEIGKGTNSRFFMRIEQIFVERDWGLEQVNRSKDFCSKACALKYIEQMDERDEKG
ncbi:MAG: hypothetical protein WA977_13005 [Halobacteriota archaeon]